MDPTYDAPAPRTRPFSRFYACVGTVAAASAIALLLGTPAASGREPAGAPVALPTDSDFPVDAPPADLGAVGKPAPGPGPVGDLLVAPPVPVQPPRVDLAILLDTSGSMDGLIHQARTQLWRIVNEFRTAKRGGLQPTLRVALYEYGKQSLSRGSGHIRQITPLTTDLDRVSEELFALRTNGGDEFCGQVIQKAARELDWSRGDGDLRLIFIAGNEPFTQGRVSWHEAIAGARREGIVVNPIHCGGDADARAGLWDRAAMLAGASLLNIDHNTAVAAVAAPQDAEIERLSGELNKTYVPFGADGGERKARQARQDLAARTGGGGGATQRAIAKSSSLYRNSDWDLVDALKDGTVAGIGELDDEALPPELRAMPAPARDAYVTKKAEERADLQARIAELSAARADHVAAEEEKAAAAGGADTFGDVLIEAVREQAEAAGYAF